MNWIQHMHIVCHILSSCKTNKFLITNINHWFQSNDCSIRRVWSLPQFLHYLLVQSYNTDIELISPQVLSERWQQMIPNIISIFLSNAWVLLLHKLTGNHLSPFTGSLQLLFSIDKITLFTTLLISVKYAFVFTSAVQWFIPSGTHDGYFFT